ncbi:MAG: DNA methyltransferase, partial [Armatimonadota bacterium]
GERFHKQQSPVALLTRILLSSTQPGDWVLDPFAGTGTTAVVARQLGRHSVSIELDPQNVACIRWRLEARREADSIAPLKHYYRFTPELERIWGTEISSRKKEPAEKIMQRGEQQCEPLPG